MSDNKREFSRVACNYDMRIYSSIKPGAYTVKVLDISRSGAFFETEHLPENGETISFELVDISSFRPVYMGSARVCRIQKSPDKESGFGVMFEKVLDGPLIHFS